MSNHTYITPEARQQVIELVKQAGDILMTFWPGACTRDFKIQQKKDGSLVTEADFASNTLLVQGLKKLFPHIAIFSEEMPPSEELKTAELAWVIDPLDGTKTFTEGNDDFSVLLALCKGTEPIFGVMYFPARQQLASAYKGEGAWLDGKKLSVSTRETIGKERLYLRNLELPTRDIFYPRWMDSGLAFFNVCRGDFDGIILRIKTHQEWDLAAPTIMLKESGAIISNEIGESIHFYREPIKYKYFICSNARVHADILAMIPSE